MCAYQEPEAYIKRFVGRALPGIKNAQFFLRRERVPHDRIKADYSVENVVIEACTRS
jgi:hypothetical protein